MKIKKPNESNKNFYLQLRLRKYRKEPKTCSSTYSIFVPVAVDYSCTIQQNLWWFLNENKIFKKTITDGTDKLSYSYIYTGELITECIISNEKNEVFKILYKYNDNKKLIEASELRPLDDLALKRTYTYNNDGTISATVYQGDLAKQTKIVHTYLITLDQEGEVAKSVIYNSLEDIYVTNTYTYDTKNNPFKNITGYGALNIDGGISGNLSRNILSQTIIRADKSKIEVFYSYEYNSNGFPTKKSAKIDVDGVKSDFTKITSY